MDNRNNMLQLCRLCLVKDDVNIPIFEEHGDIRQIFLKISSCLPVKVSREDKLPKKICDGCSFKLDTLYEFWNTSANAEKQLLTWLGEAGMNSQTADGTISAVAQQIKPTDAFVKQETIDPPDIHTEDNDDDKDYMFQQKFEESASAGPSATVTSNEEEEPPPPKRARRTAAVKAAIAMDHDSDDDDDSGEPMTKVEDESEDSEGEDQEPSFADAPSTSADDQPGPSGVGKDGVEAPFITDGSIKFICVTCLQVFNTKQELIMHERSVMEVYEHITVDQISDESSQSNTACLPDIKKCYYCESLVPKENAKLHNCFHYCKSERKYSCLICWREFDSPLELKNHTENISGYYRCSSCRNFFQEDHSCESALKICAFCKKSVKDVFSHCCFHKRTQKEFENLKGKQEITCEICRMRIPKKLIWEHSKEHTHTECDICWQSVPKTTLRLHKSREHQRVECDSCEKYFDKNVDYLKHKEQEHLARVCHICGKKFTTSIALRRHMVRCQNDDPQFKCKCCGKRFAAPDYLKRHMLVHTTEGKHQCITCNKKFKSRYNMRVHMRIHDAIKPFECSICHKTFTTKQWRDSHMKTHRAC